MPEITYRHLTDADLDRFGDIDRSEHISGFYALRNGALTADNNALEVRGWHEGEVQGYIDRMRHVLNRGGRAIGAWDGGRLCGVAVIDPRPVLDGKLVSLDLLHVSASHRGTGIGRELVHRASDIARHHGARGLYISATPSRNTVDMYRHLGATVLPEPDPELFALEPEDIHLVLLFEGDGSGGADGRGF